MIQVLTGEKGSGKTKRMIALANDITYQSKGHVIYISTNSESMFDLNSSIRLIDVSQFPISSVNSFIGFIYGILSEDYDVETILIDNLSTIISEEDEDSQRFFETLKQISDSYGIRFVLGMRTYENLKTKIEAECVAV